MNLSDLSDGDLSLSMMIKTYHTLMKERIWIDRAACEIAFHPLHPDTVAFERSPICVMSLMEYDHPGTFLSAWSRRVHRRVITVTKN